MKAKVYFRKCGAPGFKHLNFVRGITHVLVAIVDVDDMCLQNGVSRELLYDELYRVYNHMKEVSNLVYSMEILAGMGAESNHMQPWDVIEIGNIQWQFTGTGWYRLYELKEFAYGY